MAERDDTRLLGLRGLFIEAQRSNDAVAAVMIADEALKISPSSAWASQAVLGVRCAKGDWTGALSILDSNYSAHLIDKATYRRHRAVLLTARALLEPGTMPMVFPAMSSSRLIPAFDFTSRPVVSA